MRFTRRFRILVAVFLLLIGVALIVYNQFVLQKELNNQIQFDIKIMQEDTRVNKALQEKVASETSKLVTPTATPTPKLITKKGVKTDLTK